MGAEFEGVKLDKCVIGPKSETFEICDLENPEVRETFEIEIRGEISTFELLMGKMRLDGEDYETAFVLEIHSEYSEEDRMDKLPAGGYGSMLCYDFGEQANELATWFCKEQDLKVYKHISSWPVFQAVVA